MSDRKPIFYDEQRRRWRRTRRVLEVTGALFTVIIVIFLLTIVQHVRLPELLLPRARAGLHAAFVPAAVKPKVLPRRRGKRKRVEALGEVTGSKIPDTYDPLRIAFYVNWDPSSLASLQQHYRDIDLLVPEQLHAISARRPARSGARSKTERVDAIVPESRSPPCRC